MRLPRLKALSLRFYLALVIVCLVLATAWVLQLLAYRSAVISLEEDAFEAAGAAAHNRAQEIRLAVLQKRKAVTNMAETIELACGVSGGLSRECAAVNLRKLFRAEGASAARIKYWRRNPLIFGRYREPRQWPQSGMVVQDGEAPRILFSAREDSGLFLTAAFPIQSFLASGHDEQHATLFAARLEGGKFWHEDGLPESLSDRLDWCGPSPKRGEAGGYVVAVEPIVPLHGCVISYVSKAQVMAPAERLRRRLLRVSAGIAAAAAIVGFLIAAFFTAPLKRLHARIQLFRSGDLTTPVPVGGIGEARSLAEAFSSATQWLRKSNVALAEQQNKLRMAHRAARLRTFRMDFKGLTVRWERESMGDRVAAPIKLRAWLKRVHQDDRAPLIQELRRSVERGEFYAEYRVLRQERTIWVATWGQLLRDSEGKPEALVGVTTNIAARKESERVARERDRLRAANQMSASLAHEINNPLTAVVNAVDLARTTEDPETLAKLLQIAGKESKRIAAINRQMLSLYLNAEPSELVDVNEVVDHVVSSIRAEDRARIKVLGVPAVHIRGHAAEITQVVRHLLLNAVEHSPAGSSVVLRARLRRSALLAQTGLRLVILNHGGLRKDVTPAELFLPFVTSKQARGVGLGLWIVRSIVMKHGGTIRLRTFRADDPVTCCSVFLPGELPT